MKPFVRKNKTILTILHFLLSITSKQVYRKKMKLFSIYIIVIKCIEKKKILVENLKNKATVGINCNSKINR